MRTTVTLEDDVAAALRELAGQRGESFKDTLNSTLRAGLSSTAPAARAYQVPSRRMGLREGLDLDKALQLAGQLEDDEVVRKLSLRK